MVVAPKVAKFEAVIRAPLEDAIKTLLEIGFDGVEISLLDPKGLEDTIIDLKRKYSLEIPAYSTGLN
ncbi:MAG: hypothetical protein DRI61_10705, partial [Chloroflexi bacterium]